MAPAWTSTQLGHIQYHLKSLLFRHLELHTSTQEAHERIKDLLAQYAHHMAERYSLPHALLVPAIGVIRWLIFSAALLLVLERLGVSATVLWSAFTGFATVGAVAFFAAWSVLSNLFCALLIFTVGPFRVGDIIELLDTAEKPGAKGRVIDINLLYTTLEDFNSPSGQSLLQIPNALVFQRVLRRWREGDPGAPVAPSAAPATAPAKLPRPYQVRAQHK